MTNFLDCSLNFEQGVIRPPSEAKSLLLRITRNCPWNKCKFCPVYKENFFSRRSLNEIKIDIDIVAVMCDQLRALSWKMGEGGNIGDITLQVVFNNASLSDAFRNVAIWLYYDTGNIFLQDANNLVLNVTFLGEILRYIHIKIPKIHRVTTYARSSSIVLKSLEELKFLKEAGLDRVHVGLETAYDPLLKFMKKGVTAAKQIDAGQKIKAVGLELSEYVMPGLGGRLWWRDHAVHTAMALNKINPDYIRLRTLRIPKNVQLYQDYREGKFQKLTDDEIIEEIKLFILSLNNINSYLFSDHNMNLIETIEGSFPRDKEYILNILDQYLSLSARDKLLYRLCRRVGRCREPLDINLYWLRAQLEETLSQVESRGNPEDFFLEIDNNVL